MVEDSLVVGRKLLARVFLVPLVLCLEEARRQAITAALFYSSVGHALP
jgi:hypothetical protein